MTDTLRFYCANNAPVTYSSTDTAQTIREARAHNARYDHLCNR